MIHATYSQGQRVVYVGNNACEIQTPELSGKCGTVRYDSAAQESAVSVHFDGEELSQSVLKCNIIVLEDEPQDQDAEIAKAIATLERYGTLAFKRNKPAWQNIRIDGVGDYTAIVGTDRVAVGCNRISFEAVEQVYEAVQKAREYVRD